MQQGSPRMNADVERLTDRERETLRLLGQGHEAKSIASVLGLSVHTVNERLRSARRKLSVSSSREAARMLLGYEGHNKSGYKTIGVAVAGPGEPNSWHAHSRATGGKRRLIWAMLGGAMLLISAAVLMTALAGQVDPARLAAPEPVMPIPSLFAVSDYPADALAKRAQGITDYRLRVGANGRVDKCDIERSSGNAALDAATCRVITKRSRFRPAVDEAGRPVASIYLGMIHWVM